MTVQASELVTPYSTAVPLFSSAPPTWMPAYDAQRIMAYQLYEQIYWNVPETFKLQQRGTDANPIYIPTARTIVDTTNRYVGKDFGFMLDPDVGSDQDRLVLNNALLSLFRRERFWSKFASNKRYGLIRGDWCWHVYANPLKAEGTRISIEALDPGSYFPVFESDVKDDGSPTKVVAVHIVEQIVNPADNKIVLKRQTYTKGLDPATNDGSDLTIYNSISLYDQSKPWQKPGDSPISVIKPPTALPPQITSIPVYHIRNIETPEDPFGSSELRGIETVIGAIHQAISDEDLALALDGFGMYATDGGPPVDENGQITNWILGPGQVVEHQKGSKWERVNGVSGANVDAALKHVGFLAGSVKEASGTPDIAIGKVDVAVAESGISLTLQMGPMLSKVSEKEQIITDVHRQMYWDLATGWLPAFEGITSLARAEPSYGNALPDDKAAQVTEIIELVAAGFADAEWGRTEVAKIRGYDFGNGMAARVVSEMAEKASAIDPFAARMAAESEAEEGTANG